MATPDQADVGEVLLDKVRTFTESLSPDERAMFAVLLAPGIEAAWANQPGAGTADEEVVGFGVQDASVEWQPSTLGEHLTAAVQRRRLQVVEGDGSSDG